jgi:acyl carrier protein
MATARADDLPAKSPATLTIKISVESILAELTRMIAHDLDVRIEEKDIDPTVPLLEGGLTLDSMVLFELITCIEKRYGTSFSTENLNSEVFANLTVLSQHIYAMMQSSQNDPGATQ